jgi:hypothetical protein
MQVSGDVKVENCVSHVVIYVRNLAAGSWRCKMHRKEVKLEGSFLFSAFLFASPEKKKRAAEIREKEQREPRTRCINPQPSHEHLLMCGLFCFPFAPPPLSATFAETRALRRETRVGFSAWGSFS